jgi:hypothetical protein
MMTIDEILRAEIANLEAQVRTAAAEAAEKHARLAVLVGGNP